MKGRPRKPPAERQRGRRTADITLLPVTRETPPAPKNLLPETVELWDAYWKSPVAGAAIDVDLGALHRWATNVDEWTRAMRALRRKRIVKGSTGQLRLNPLAAYAASLEARILTIEQHYGLTPLSRLRLGITAGEAAMTAAELNAMLDDEIQQEEQADPILGQWRKA